MITASLTGIVVGIVVGILGAGGGILAVPILVYALGQSPHSATAESLVIVGLTALVAMATRWRAVHLREGFIFGFGAIVGRQSVHGSAHLWTAAFCSSSSPYSCFASVRRWPSKRCQAVR